MTGPGYWRPRAVLSREDVALAGTAVVTGGTGVIEITGVVVTETKVTGSDGETTRVNNSKGNSRSGNKSRRRAGDKYSTIQSCIYNSSIMYWL